MLPLILILVTLTGFGCSHQQFFVKNVPPVGMVHIPAGWFEMGSSEDDGIVGMTIGVDELPRHKVYVNDFYIDKYEVTNARFREFLIRTGNPYQPSHWKEMATFEKGEENYPVVDVDWMDVDSYCRWAGKRLPNEAEWEKAARGTDGRLWPWGNEYDPSGANTKESGRGWTADVGSYPADVSPYGVYDMAGNAREWVAGWYEQYSGNTLPPGFYKGPYRVLRGGSFHTPVYLNARVAARFALTSDETTRGFDWHTNLDQGFRCAKDP